MTRTDAFDLIRLEKVVESGLKTMGEVAVAMYEIKTRGLWKITHKSWEAYCQQRFKISRPRSYQLLQMGEDLSTGVDTLNEAQSRVLADLPPEIKIKVL